MMTSFMGSSQLINEIDRFFANESEVSFKKLLELPNLNSQVSSVKITSYLTDPSTTVEMIHLLTETSQRSIHKKINGLYNSPIKKELLRVFADSIPTLKEALKVLDDRNDENAMYAAGTIVGIITNALSIYPVQVHNVFKYSKEFYPKVIENIDLCCIYSAFLDYMDQLSDSKSKGEKKYPDELMWHLFRALSGRNDHPPRICFLTSNFDIKKLSRPAQIENAINILAKYFATLPIRTEDFQDMVMKYIIDTVRENDDYPSLFTLAKSIGQNDELQEIALNKLKNAIENGMINPKWIIEWTSYLSICHEKLTEESILRIVASIIDEKAYEFVLTNILSLVENYMSSHPNCFSFQNKMKEIICFMWNAFHQKNPNIYPFLFDLANKINIHAVMNLTDEVMPSWFRDNLLHWSSEEYYNLVQQDGPICEPKILILDQTFPESFYNKDDVNSLKWGENNKL